MKTPRAIAFLLLTAVAIRGQNATPQRPVTAEWKPQNELQNAAETVRLLYQRDLSEVIAIHYSKISKEERNKLVLTRAAHADQDVELTKKFAAVVANTVAEKRCRAECRSHLIPLLDEFSAMSETIQKLNKEQVMPELLPLERTTFEQRLKNARQRIRLIHLVGNATPG